MAVPVLEAFQRSTRQGDGGSFTMAPPAGITAGELLCLVVMNDATSSDDGFLPVAGWGLQAEAGGGLYEANLAIYTRVADGSEGSVVVAPDSSFHWIGFYQRWSSVDTSVGVDGISVIGDATLYSGSDSILNASVDALTDESAGMAFWVGDGADCYPFALNSASGWQATLPDEQTGRSLDEVSEFGVAGGFLTREMPLAGATGDVWIGQSASDGCTGRQVLIAGGDPPAPSGGVLWRNSDWGNGANNATVTIPADTQVGDLMIIHTANKNTNGYINVPAGWTLVDEEVGALTPARLWRIAEAGDAGTDLLIDQVSTTANASAVIDVFYGHDPDDPFMDLGIISDPGSTQPSWPTPDVTADGPGLLVTAGFQETVWDNLTSPPEITELTYGADSSRTVSAVTGSKAVTEAGAVGQFDYTQHTTARIKTSALLIRQAAVVPPDTGGFPVIDGATAGVWNSASPLVVELPPDIVAGDGLLIWLSGGQVALVNDWNGFTEIVAQGDYTVYQHVAYKVATGNEGNSVNIGMSGTLQTSWVCAKIKEGTFEPWDTNPPQFATSRGYLDSIVLAELTPTWGEAKTLWLVNFAIGAANTYLDPGPTGYDLVEEARLGNNKPSSVWSRALEAASEQPSGQEPTANNPAETTTMGIEPLSIVEAFGQFSLDGDAGIDPTGTYEPALFTGQFALTGEADVDGVGFFFEDLEGLFDLDGEASLDFTGQAEVPVFTRDFDLDAEATLQFSGVSEIYGVFGLDAVATIVELDGSHIPPGSEAVVGLNGRAALGFTGTFSIPDTSGAFGLTARADIEADGADTAPTFTGQTILRATSTISGEGVYQGERYGAFSLDTAADFGIWAQVPLQPGTGGSVKGDGKDPARVWSLEDPPIVESTQSPASVEGKQ